MNILPSLALLFSLSLASIAQAAEPSASKIPLADTSGYFLQLVSGLGVVLLSIAALAWLLKRINRLPNRDQQGLELIASLSVGQRERVVIVRAGTTELVLGVAPGRIAKLGEIPPSQQTVQDAPLHTANNTNDDETSRKDAFSTLIAKVRKDTAP